MPRLRRHPAGIPGRGRAGQHGRSLGVRGGLCLLATFDDSRWSKDQVAGFLIALATSATLGLVGLGQKTGMGPAIAGVALSALALILFVGML